MSKPDLLGLATALEDHSRPGMMAFTFYELLDAAGYTDQEIRDVAAALAAIVSES